MALCSFCNAPMPKSGIICDYCGQRNAIDLIGEKKRISEHPHEKRNCPICKIPLHTVNVGVKTKLYIEHCESCYGLFFDHEELESLIKSKVETKKSNIDYKKLQQLNNHPRYIDALSYRKCPVCEKVMNRVNYAKRSGVIMDVCSEHGVWLDPGELTQILEWSYTANFTPEFSSKVQNILFKGQINQKKERAKDVIDSPFERRNEKSLNEITEGLWRVFS